MFLHLHTHLNAIDVIWFPRIRNGRIKISFEVQN